MNILVLIFDCTGEGRCLYSELIELPSIGPLTVKRASAVEFDQESQRWQVWSEQGEILHTATSRCQCLEWEAEHFSRI